MLLKKYFFVGISDFILGIVRQLALVTGQVPPAKVFKLLNLICYIFEIQAI